MSLPARGSAQDLILLELYERELSEKMAQAALFARLIGVGLGISDKLVSNVLDLYFEEVTQESYRTDRIKAKRTKERDDRERLNRVASMTVPDDQLPEIPKSKRSKKPGGSRRGK